VYLKAGQTLDRESQAEYTLNIKANDGTVDSQWKELKIQITDIEEPSELRKTHYYITSPEGSV
jgi:hypothetical protein